MYMYKLGRTCTYSTVLLLNTTASTTLDLVGRCSTIGSTSGTGSTCTSYSCTSILVCTGTVPATAVQYCNS